MDSSQYLLRSLPLSLPWLTGAKCITPVRLHQQVHLAWLGLWKAMERRLARAIVHVELNDFDGDDDDDDDDGDGDLTIFLLLHGAREAS